MNTTLIIAGAVSILVGVVHSVLGEILIFSRLRQGTLVPKAGQPILRERHVRILWATWHLVTIFGICFAVILFKMANPGHAPSNPVLILNSIAVAMCAGSALVCFATKGKHPGWIGLLLVAALIWFAQI